MLKTTKYNEVKTELSFLELFPLIDTNNEIGLYKQYLKDYKEITNILVDKVKEPGIVLMIMEYKEGLEEYEKIFREYYEPILLRNIEQKEFFLFSRKQIEKRNKKIKRRHMYLKISLGLGLVEGLMTTITSALSGNIPIFIVGNVTLALTFNMYKNMKPLPEHLKYGN